MPHPAVTGRNSSPSIGRPPDHGMDTTAASSAFKSLQTLSFCSCLVEEQICAVQGWTLVLDHSVNGSAPDLRLFI